MTAHRTEPSGRPSLWRALDAPAEVRHTTAHPAVAREHQGLYTYTVHPMPAPRPGWLLLIGGWWTTLVPSLVVAAGITVLFPSADPLTTVAVVQVLDVVGLSVLVMRR